MKIGNEIMRISLFFFILGLCLLGFLLWAFSGLFLGLGILIWVLFTLVAVKFSDRAVLSFLRARQWQSADQTEIFEAILHQAYKLDLPVPEIYTYHGFFQRAYVFTKGKRLTLVFDSNLIQSLSPKEIGILSFFLMIEAKAGISSKRTFLFYFAGAIQTVLHIPVALLSRFQRHNHFAEALQWWEDYLVSPWLELMFRSFLGKKFFKEVKKLLLKYPQEASELKILRHKLMVSPELSSFTHRGVYRLGHQGRSLGKKLVLLFEFFPHEIEQVWATHE